MSIGFKSGLWQGFTPKPSETKQRVFQSFRGGLAGEFQIIVLLRMPSVELEVTTWWPGILLQDFLVESKSHGSINYGKSSRSWSCKAAPDLHTTTTCWYDVLFTKYCVSFTPSKKISLCLINPQNIWDNQNVFWKMWDEPLRSLWSAVAFVLELSLRCHSSLSLCWIMNTELTEASKVSSCSWLLFPHRARQVWTAFCPFLCVIYKVVSWSESFKCDQNAKKEQIQVGSTLFHSTVVSSNKSLNYNTTEVKNSPGNTDSIVIPLLTIYCYLIFECFYPSVMQKALENLLWCHNQLEISGCIIKTLWFGC